jgi:hypothetical protein
LEYLFYLVHEPQTRPASSDITDWLKQLRAHGTEPHHRDDERTTSSIDDDVMSSISAPAMMEGTRVPRAPTSDRGGGSSSAQPSRPAGGDRAAGAGRSDSTDGAIVVASNDRGDKPPSPPPGDRSRTRGEAAARSDSRATTDSHEQFHDAIYDPPAASTPGRGGKDPSAQTSRPAGGDRAGGAVRGDKPPSPPPRDRSRTRGEAAARPDSRADSLDEVQFWDTSYVPPAKSTPGRGGKDPSAQPTAPKTDKSYLRWYENPDASPPKERPKNYHRS